MVKEMRTPFQRNFDMEYGLCVSKYNNDIGIVQTVTCHFCLKFGREAKPCAKSQRTTKTQVFQLPFCMDKYKRCHALVHPEKWKDFQEAIEMERRPSLTMLSIIRARCLFISRAMATWISCTIMTLLRLWLVFSCSTRMTTQATVLVQRHCVFLSLKKAHLATMMLWMGKTQITKHPMSNSSCFAYSRWSLGLFERVDLKGCASKLVATC